MIDDERREVAARLRELPRTADADGCCTAWDVLYALGMKYCDTIGFVNAVDATRLADLIDRPTTRCHGKFKTKYGRETPCCEVCGYSIGDARWNYCPKCGAEVVE